MNKVRSLDRDRVGSLGAAWAALGCMCIAAIGFWPGHSLLWLPVLASIGGWAVLAVALRLKGDYPTAFVTRVAPAVERPVRWLPTLLGVICLVFLALLSTPQSFPQQLLQLMPIYTQALILLAGIVLLVGGIGGLSRRDVTILRQFFAVHRREITLILAIMGLALAVRVYRLDAVRALIDEGTFLITVVKMRVNPNVPLAGLMDPVITSTRLFPFVQLLLSDIFGSTLAVFRLAAVLFGVLTVGATYALARLLYDRRTAYIASLLLATFPPHIHMS